MEKIKETNNVKRAKTKYRFDMKVNFQIEQSSCCELYQ